MQKFSNSAALKTCSPGVQALINPPDYEVTTYLWSDIIAKCKSLTKQWTYGPTLLLWCNHFHTPAACYQT